MGLLIDNAIPGGYYVHNGRKVRWHLETLLPTSEQQELRDLAASRATPRVDAITAQVDAAGRAFRGTCASITAAMRQGTLMERIGQRAVVRMAKH